MVKRHHPPPPIRLVSRNSRVNVIRRGVSHFCGSDLYHFLVTLSWPAFFAIITLSYVAVNTLFALAYMAGGDCIENAQPGSFRDTFVFSVQTMATIGYGSMYPRTNYAHGLVAFEALVGLLGFAMATGIMFARFSLPTARVLFSRVAVIAPYDGVPTLMFRTANQRNNFILEAQVRVTLVRNEVTKEGHFMRRFYDLQLVRHATPVFALSWTIMHQIDETSPLYNATAESLAEAETELVITLTGIDESVSQTLHTRYAFASSEILWNMRFVDILSRMPDGRRLVDYTYFHDVVPV